MAMAGMVVSNPTPKKMKCFRVPAGPVPRRPGANRRSAPPGLGPAGAPGRSPGTRSMSPKEARTTLGSSPKARKASMSSWAVTHTGQPGPEMSCTCSGSSDFKPKRAAVPRSYHSGETTDLGEVVRRLVEERPGAIGGGGRLLAGRQRGHQVAGRARRRGCRPRCAAGPPSRSPSTWPPASGGSTARGASCGSTGSGSCAGCGARRPGRRGQFPGLFDAAAVARATTFAEYDQLMTAPLHGFASRDDYYARCSARPVRGRDPPPLPGHLGGRRPHGAGGVAAGGRRRGQPGGPAGGHPPRRPHRLRGRRAARGPASGPSGPWPTSWPAWRGGLLQAALDEGHHVLDLGRGELAAEGRSSSPCPW